MMRTAAGKKWVDNKLAEFDPESYYCIFVGDLGNECTDEHLITAFSKYPSFQKARVVVDQLTKKNKGYGFVAFKEAADYLAAMREMNGKYVGNRPVKLRKGTWDKRADVEGLNNLNKKLVRDKQQQQQKK
jgi:RNA recognition motif-containing protein